MSVQYFLRPREPHVVSSLQPPRSYLEHALSKPPWEQLCTAVRYGKERMTAYFNTCADTEPFTSMVPHDDAARAEFIKAMHLRKTDLFLEIVDAGALPLRPGVRRLVAGAYTRLLFSST